ncbi:arylesterase [Pedobacter aquatilis]|uniref:arylesterase n=1 Tax=Pedobacter aquatilis TaxID=351343 RepID=UPI0025B289A7|nr:arylesterase [Pedobacter aquatilis]MDN3588210.1 arylesterase [Pedobacter aquatilis]
MKKVIFFGDSLSAGYGLRTPNIESLPALINQKILKAGLPFTVINAGISGDTTRSAKNRLEKTLNGAIDLFIIELGANDFLRAYPPSEITSNIREIIKKVQSYNPDITILLLGLSLPSWIPLGYAAAYANLFSDLAVEFEIAFIPDFLKGVAGNKLLNMPDGVHPLAEGYKVASENIWPKISDLLSKSSINDKRNERN